eukprot:TRINITY_DN2717_c1_g3_i2.p1 TRINITY_DN2717_c1_g3~~TRINITY_DN2717_c1_g3_i2.p1  ORF type:complete len:131 (+),score=68.69 TRINITY_DN2717_c1_g3_i2:91-483(+)
MVYSKKQLKATGALSADEKKKYEEIAAAVKASKGGDAAKSLKRIETALAACGTAEEEKEEKFDEKSGDFVGIMLDGCGGNTCSKGDLAVDTSDVKIEEPPVIVDEEDADDSNLRELWGDGDKNPNENDEE